MFSLPILVLALAVGEETRAAAPRLTLRNPAQSVRAAWQRVVRYQPDECDLALLLGTHCSCAGSATYATAERYQPDECTLATLLGTRCSCADGTDCHQPLVLATALRGQAVTLREKARDALLDASTLATLLGTRCTASSACARPPLLATVLPRLRGGWFGRGDKARVDAKADAKVEREPEEGQAWWGNSWQGASPGEKASLTLVSRARARGLMKRGRKLGEVEAAVKLLRDAHERDPDDTTLALELADALNTVMRIKTDANSLIIDGSLDTPANKKVWSSLGQEALPLARVARDARPDDPKSLAVYADSFMFFSCSKGIVKQALGGTAKQYIKMSNDLIRKAYKWDSCVGNIFLAGFYNSAPWPVGNKQKAKKLLTEAAEAAPTRRNLYYSGVNAYVLGEYERAEGFFERALQAGCGSETEEDIGGFLLSEAKRALEASRAGLAKSKAA